MKKTKFNHVSKNTYLNYINVATTQDVAIAKEKNWNMLDTNNDEYNGSTGKSNE